MTKIFFIGLSNKIGTEPLASDTLSGSLIDKIIEKLDSDCIKVNLVNFAPIDDCGKLRYPDKNEMDIGYLSLKLTLEDNNPYIAVCLGNKVSGYLVDKVNNIISIKHPSYIAVYKRKEIDSYIENTVEIINSIIFNKKSKNSCNNYSSRV